MKPDAHDMVDKIPRTAVTVSMIRLGAFVQPSTVFLLGIVLLSFAAWSLLGFVPMLVPLIVIGVLYWKSANVIRTTVVAGPLDVYHPDIAAAAGLQGYRAGVGPSAIVPQRAPAHRH